MGAALSWQLGLMRIRASGLHVKLRRELRNGHEVYSVIRCWGGCWDWNALHPTGEAPSGKVLELAAQW